MQGGRGGAAGMPASLYEPPHWSALPPCKFSIEIIREGVVISNTPIYERPHYVFGRCAHIKCMPCTYLLRHMISGIRACFREAATAHIVLPHPSVSRAHAVIQHSEAGEVYVCDLDSTHGTTINKKALPPKQFVRLCS